MCEELDYEYVYNYSIELINIELPNYECIFHNWH